MNRSHGLNDRFYLFHRGGKIAIQTGPALFQLQGKNCYTTSPAYLARPVTFPILISYFKTRLHLARLNLTVQNTVRHQQTCNLVSSRVILSP